LRIFAATLWFWWSFWVFGELFMDAVHAYSDVPLHHDAGYFVRLTGISPAIASGAILTVTAILSVPLIRVVAQELREGGFGE
jgi:4-hydroxybenzoate polyprenyltransferase